MVLTDKYMLAIITPSCHTGEMKNAFHTSCQKASWQQEVTKGCKCHGRASSFLLWIHAIVTSQWNSSFHSLKDVTKLSGPYWQASTYPDITPPHSTQETPLIPHFCQKADNRKSPRDVNAMEEDHLFYCEYIPMLTLQSNSSPHFLRYLIIKA